MSGRKTSFSLNHTQEGVYDGSYQHLTLRNNRQTVFSCCVFTCFSSSILLIASIFQFLRKKIRCVAVDGNESNYEPYLGKELPKLNNDADLIQVHLNRIFTYKKQHMVTMLFRFYINHFKDFYR